MNPRKRRLLKLKALEAKQAADEPVVKTVVAEEPKPVVKKIKETKPAPKRKTRKTTTKKEE